AVVGYEGFFRDEKKVCYLVMEFVDGPSLSQILTQRALSVDEVYRLRDRLVGGLAAAHARGVTHRDLAPDNVILPDGQVERAKLIDFGIAKLADALATTIIGTAFAGKLRYAAPEQLGLFGGKVSPVSDIYSLGLVLAAALGKPLAMGDSLGTAVLARQQVPDLAQIPAQLQPLLRVMLQPDPAQRPQGVEELLRRWPQPGQTSPDLRESKVPGREHPRNWPRPQRMMLLLTASTLAIALGWLGYREMHRTMPQPGEQPPEDQSPTGVQPTALETQSPVVSPPRAPVPTTDPEAPSTAGPTPPPTSPESVTTERPELPAAVSTMAPAPMSEPTPTLSTVPATGAVPSIDPTARSPQPTPPVDAQPALDAGSKGTEPQLSTEALAPVVIPPAVVAPLVPDAKIQAPSPPPIAMPAAPRRSAPSKPPASSKPKPVVKEAPKVTKAPQKTLNPPRRSGGSRPARCGDVLSKLQLGEPISGADRAILKECR
ncbi:MAG TPA: protein kinase, partial [Lamprocystis sp. (in: g-proteobacteria)]|nr:protein kinase [Lamprocystis sp. (in: g-proteobacteria)]